MCGIEPFMPQRGIVPKPRGGAARLSWEHGVSFSPQPQRGCDTDAARTIWHNPVGVVSISRSLPRVARASQPWAMSIIHHNLNEVASRHGVTKATTPLGLFPICDRSPRVARASQPWAMSIIHHNLNEVASRHGVTKATTPLGLFPICDRSPRVARASQPWAGGHSPVGAGASAASAARPAAPGGKGGRK